MKHLNAIPLLCHVGGQGGVTAGGDIHSGRDLVVVVVVVWYKVEGGGYSSQVREVEVRAFR